MLCGWNRGRRLSVIFDHQCRISHGCGGMARSAVCFARTLRHRASFVRFARDVVVGRGCTGDDTHAPGFSWCVRLRTADRFSPGGRMGRGERREHNKGRGTTHNSQAGPPTRPSARSGPRHGLRAGLCSLTFSVLVVYFGCCLVAADASLCVHLSSVSVRQFSRVFVPESRASEPISLQVDACVWYPTITGGFLSKVLFNCTGC
jgi:hypothetical protein